MAIHHCSLPVTLDTRVDESDIILVVQVGSDSLGSLDESLQGELVAEIVVQVVLGGLQVVHLLDGIVVVSDLGERERLVIELLGSDSKLRVGTSLSQFTLDMHGVLPVLDVEVSGELAELIVKVILRDLKRWWAVLKLHKLEESFLVRDGRGGSSHSQNGSELHFNEL